MNIDWSKAPEGFPLWLEGLGDNAKYSGWYRRNGEVFEHETSGQFRAFREGQFFIVHYKPVQPAWSGEGLPPVGTVCEFNTAAIADEEWHKLLPLYEDIEVTIIAHCTQPSGTPTAVFTFNCEGGLQVEMGVAHLFKPIRTPEQIAKEEREAAVKEMIGHIGGSRRAEATASR